MSFGKISWRAIRRYFLIFTTIAFLPLVLIYLVYTEQFSKLKRYKALKSNNDMYFNAKTFRYPVVLLGGKNQDLTVVTAITTRGKKHTKYDKYINESRIPLIPDEAIQTLSASDMLEVDKRMTNRLQFLLRKCSELGLDAIGNDSWHKPNAWEFLVNKKFHLIWCNVFKVASSSWMFNFNILAGYSADFLHQTKENYLHLARERYPRVTLDQLKKSQNNSITFIIARHPFERLLSAYRDKFVFAVPHSFHDKLGRKIIRTYRKKKLDRYGSKYPTFPEFIRWLLDQVKQGNNNLDMHFVSATKFCTPCLINFNVIMKFETLEEDQLYLIKKAGLQHIIAPEWRNAGKGGNTRALLEQSYSQLTRQQLDGLYNYYRYDFELFNYSATSYYNICKKSTFVLSMNTSNRTGAINIKY